MTATANLALPLIEASQAQKHVTHNEALRMLDAAIQIAVIDMHRTAPPASPAAGDRHVVAAGATGAWAGHAQSIACWHDGAWLFLAPHSGWCIWSLADAVIKVFDGTTWHDAGTSYDFVPKLGVNTSATAPNLLSIRSNAALLAAIAIADGGSGDARLQLSKESTARTASAVFSNNYSGRAEFGLVGSDAFKLKVSADGVNWVEAFVIDQATGNLALPRALALGGAITPPAITANQNDYSPTGLPAAAVVRMSSDASRSITGLTGGGDGRLLVLRNVGSFDLMLKDASASSAAANRFALGLDLTLRAGQACQLQYDATLSRWVCIGASGAGSQPRSVLPANAGLEIWQRGVSIAVAASAAAYTADRWLLATGASQASTVSRQAGLGSASRYCGRFQRNAGQTGVGQMLLEYPLETDELLALRGQRATVALRLRAGSTFSPGGGNVTVTLHTGTGAAARRSSGAYAGEATPIDAALAITTTAQRLSLTSAAAIDGNITCASLAIRWTPTGTAGATDYLEIDDVQLHPLPYAPDFVATEFAADLAAAMAWYEKSNNYASVPTGFAINDGQAVRFGHPTADANIQVAFKVRKRAAPSSVTICDATGAAARVSQYGTGAIWTHGGTIDFQVATENGIAIAHSIAGSAITQFGYVAEAGL